MKCYKGLQALIALIIAVCFHACQMEEDILYPQDPSLDKNDCITLTMQSNKMLPKQVASRASDPKAEAEKAIHHMYVFYFNATSGELLQPYTDPKTTKQRFFPYQETDLTIIKIDRKAMLEANVKTSDNNINTESMNVRICVLANMKGVVSGVDSDGYPLIGNQRVTYSLLQNLSYNHPSISNDNSHNTALLSIPKGGIPMEGESAFVLKDGTNAMVNNLTVDLVAQMARVDFSIQLDAPIYRENYPRITMQNWKVGNLPLSVVVNSSSDETALDETNKAVVEVNNNQIIYNKNGSINFSFYMFENIQNKTRSFEYPTGDESKHQRYKPLLANGNATYVELNTLYATYDNTTYKVKYKLYLGANHTDDFKVKRNYQYKNDITIIGLDNKDWTDGNGNPLPDASEVTYDARVNISESNPYYISMLNERTIDAHIEVLPMDIYFFGGDNVETQKIVVRNSNAWIGMEKVSSEDMLNGTVSYVDKQEIIGEKYMAGHGKRKYFTVGLLAELNDETTNQTINEVSYEIIELTDNRDRIYFYIDENLSKEVVRKGTIYLDYYENGVLVRTEERVITQTHLLEVYWERDNKSGTIYMEQIEEYLDDYDPLNTYNSTMVYDGLPWGFADTEISQVGDEKPYNNYRSGLNYTNSIIGSDWKKTLNAVNSTANAFDYCYNRNKRSNPNGTVDSGDQKWFLPGITQMEFALEKYFNTFPEFQNKLYWSSSAGKITTTRGLSSSEQSKGYARATKVDINGIHVESELKITKNLFTGKEESRVEGEGYKHRVNSKLRIRAFRIDLK